MALFEKHGASALHEHHELRLPRRQQLGRPPLQSSLLVQNSSTCTEKKHGGDVAHEQTLKDADRVEVGLSPNPVAA